jgi:ABC-type branched-subunit amino acid transport system ATPase component
VQSLNAPLLEVKNLGKRFGRTEVLSGISFSIFDREIIGVIGPNGTGKAGINIVAIQNHIESESPRIVFLHYWGVGATTDLAKGLKAALDTQKK